MGINELPLALPSIESAVVCLITIPLFILAVAVFAGFMKAAFRFLKK